MKYSVSHTTRYIYSAPVHDSLNDAHLCPVSNEGQRCESFELHIDPHSPSILRRLDFYTNQVHHFEVVPAHDYLQVEARSVVTTFDDERDLATPSDARLLAGLERDERFYDFMGPSPRVSIPTAVRHECRSLQSSTAAVQDTVGRIMDFMEAEFRYLAGSTGVESTVEQFFEQRQGVCQDFAHLMLALCRGCGIPARYVSGYFYEERSDTPAANGASASHAWVECFLPGIGWVGYDPTHNRPVSERYIKVAVGRDYADVRPLAGTYRGQCRAELAVSVVVALIGGSG